MKSAGSHFLSASAFTHYQNAAVYRRGIGNALQEVQKDFGFAYVAVVVPCHMVNNTIIGKKCQ